MLASGISQYINPDYLQPLPTTLDAKKSPLALLAQTCSSIGKDPTPAKTIIPPIDKKEKDQDKDDKRPNSRGSKASSADSSGRDSSSKPGFRTVPPKDIPPLVPIGGDKSGATTPTSSSSSSSSSSKLNSSLSSSAPTSSSSSDAVPHSMSVAALSTSSSSSSSSSVSSHMLSSSRDSRPLSAAGASSSQRSSSRSGREGERERHGEYGVHYHASTPPASSAGHRLSASASPPSVKSSSVPVSHPASLGLPKPAVAHHASLLPGLSAAHPLAAAYPHLSLLDPSLQSYHSALAAHSASLSGLSVAAAACQTAQNALKAGASGNALSPYVAYARIRTPSGATTLVPVCRDPYCTNCQLTMQNSHLSSHCSAPGCAQCAHEKTLTSLSTGMLAGLGSAAGLPIHPSISQASALSSLGLSSALHPHSLYNPLAAHQGLGYVCSWVAAGSEYCGKRFTTSEELLQHLRTHTSSAVEASSFAAYGALGLHPGLAAAAAAGSHHYPGSPLSPNTLRRTYPTSLSPVSSLLSASRYHPYKSHLGAVPPPPSLPSAPGLPAVGPYLSPYSLYGQRLGAAAVP